MMRPSCRGSPATSAPFEGTIPVDPGSGNTPGGLWSLEFGIGGMNGDPNTLYFTDALPSGAAHGCSPAPTGVASARPRSIP
jgi:hypothetical protein